MAFKFLDRARMTTATTGTGTITLGSAVSKYQTFAAAGIANGDTIHYVIEDGTAWEIGTGTYTSSGTTLARSLISSSTGSLISLSGTAEVFASLVSGDIGVSANDLVQLNASGQLPVVSGALLTSLGSLVGMQVFTAAGTYTPTAGTNAIFVIGAGNGGGGAGAASGTIGGGGAGAEVRIGRFGGITGTYSVTFGATGSGGAANTIGTAGGNCSLGSLMTCNGGAAGTAPATGTNSTGGSGGSGGTSLPGEAGLRGGTATAPVPFGRGGGNFFGAGSEPPIAATTAGLAAVNFGTGGGGGAGAAQLGGAGKTGVFFIFEFK